MDLSSAAITAGLFAPCWGSLMGGAVLTVGRPARPLPADHQPKKRPRADLASPYRCGSVRAAAEIHGLKGSVPLGCKSRFCADCSGRARWDSVGSVIGAYEGGLVPDGFDLALITITPPERVTSPAALQEFFHSARLFFRRLYEKRGAIWGGALVLEAPPRPGELSEFRCPFYTYELRGRAAKLDAAQNQRFFDHLAACHSGSCPLHCRAGFLPAPHVHIHALVYLRACWWGRESLRYLRQLSDNGQLRSWAYHRCLTQYQEGDKPYHGDFTQWIESRVNRQVWLIEQLISNPDAVDLHPAGRWGEGGGLRAAVEAAGFSVVDVEKIDSPEASLTYMRKVSKYLAKGSKASGEARFLEGVYVGALAEAEGRGALRFCEKFGQCRGVTRLRKDPALEVDPLDLVSPDPIDALIKAKLEARSKDYRVSIVSVSPASAERRGLCSRPEPAPKLSPLPPDLPPIPSPPPPRPGYHLNPVNRCVEWFPCDPSQESDFIDNMVFREGWNSRWPGFLRAGTPLALIDLTPRTKSPGDKPAPLIWEGQGGPTPPLVQPDQDWLVRVKGVLVRGRGSKILHRSDPLPPLQPSLVGSDPLESDPPPSDSDRAALAAAFLREAQNLIPP